MPQITGTTGDDTLYTTGGNDTVDAGDGAHDLLIIDYSPYGGNFSASGVGNLTNGAGTSVESHNVELFDITMGGGNDTVMTGDRDDTVSGGAGNDDLDTGAGHAAVDGGTGADLWRANLASVAGAYNFDAALSGTQNIGNGFQVTSIEGLNISSGDSSDKFLTYDNGLNDSIFTAGGDDTVQVGGNTAGASGIDYVNGGNGTGDLLVVHYGNKSGTFVIDGPFITNNAGTSVEAVNFERYDITVGTGNDSISGGSGDDTLNGGLGADSLAGAQGNDVYRVDNPGDKIFEVAGEGADTVFAAVSFVLSGGQSVDVLATASQGGTSALNLTGNELVQAIRGNDGANILTGGGGADSLYGFGGNDIFHVDNAAEKVFEAAGQGADTVFASLSYTLSTGQSIDLLATTARSATTAITFTGNDQAQRIDGNYGVNGLYGGDGNDTLYGFDGNDRLSGGNGHDQMDGGNGADTFGYSAVVQSTGAGRDLIQNINFAQDRIDLQVAVSGIDAKVVGGTLNEAAFDANLAGAIGSGQLAAHHAVLFDPSAGTADHGADLYLVIDVNGTAGYQAGQDYVIELANAAGTLTLNDFT